jgi:flagellar motor switch protein FliM
VSSNVSAAEVEALLHGNEPRIGPYLQVAARDFGEPRRLSPQQLDKLVRNAQKALPDIEGVLHAWLRGEHEVALAAIVEAHAGTLLASLAEPLCLLAFECAGHPAWAIWERRAAVIAAEIALGADEKQETTLRTLTTLEQRVLERILTPIVQALAGKLGVEPKNMRLIQEREELTRWEDAPNADPQRIGVQLQLTGTGGTSNLRCYFAGVKLADTPPPAKDKAKQLLPQHMQEIDVEVGATLGHAELALEELVALEVGDVIPLGLEVGGLITLHVEGRVCATAQLGEHHGRLAIRVGTLGVKGEVR